MSQRIWKASRKGQPRRNYKATNNRYGISVWSLSDWAFCSLRIPLGFVSVQATDKNLSDLLLSTFKRFELTPRSKPRSTLFQILKAAKNKVCALKWIKNKFNIFLNFAGNSSMVVNFKQSWFSCLLTFLEQNYGCKDAAQAQQ